MVQSRNMVVDIGNTRIKTGLFDGLNLLEARYWVEKHDFRAYINGTEYEQLVVTSVGMGSEQIAGLLGDLPYRLIATAEDIEMELDYDTPGSLGVDRLLGLYGASIEYPNTDLLVIDMGSCITYDLKDANDIFRGGIIAPGLSMRLRSMHEFTLALPDLRGNWTEHLTDRLGKNTSQCMTQGVYQAIIHEINGFIDGFRQEYPALVTLLTGGDAVNFESKLKEPIFADFNLVIKGLNRILNQ